MASGKAALKSIKDAIDKKDFATAAEKASILIQGDPKNYTALLFLGFAQDKLDQKAEAEKAYEKALNLKPRDLQALKGLIALYEKQGGEKLEQHHEVVRRLAEHCGENEDITQCQSVVDKYELFAKKHGSRAQYRQALELLLPASQGLYSILEGRIPHPSHTYTRILESAEAEEKEWVNNQIGERRTRLGARIDQVKQEVKREATELFDITAKLRAVIDWMDDDEARHGAEEKLLQRAYDTLSVLPADEKPAQRDEVLNLANGMVIIKHPFPLAWKIALEWVDAEALSDWDVGIFREYIVFFPDDGLSNVLRGFLDSNLSPFPKLADTPEQISSDDERDEKLSEADRLILMVEGLENSSDSLLAQRIMADMYLSLNEYQSAADTARKAQALHMQATIRFSVDLQTSLDAVNMTLANALISYQSPRHHPEARKLFEDILKRKPTNTPALLGVGLVLEEDEDYHGAVDFLDRALQRDPENIKVKLELAWCRALDKDLEHGLTALESVLAMIEAEKPVNLTMKSEALYRIGYCKWQLDSSKAARKDKSGTYQYLLDSIKANSSYAPPYTLLGIYFEEYGKSKKRARVAFQKAFELSSSEIEAAEHLAKKFADGAEWELVELVARRVIDSGKARPAPGSKKKASSWPYAAIGVVEMNKQQYPKAIVAYQAALRTSPEDYHCWVGLGESYHNMGRYISATRAFHNAENLDHGLPDEQTWFAKYMLANVQREMGAYDEAIEGYNNVLAIKPDEFGVAIALLQTLAESAWAKTDLGMFGYAAGLANQAIEKAKSIAQTRPQLFNLWKAVGDACSVMARTPTHNKNADLASLQVLLHEGDASVDLTILQDVDEIDGSTLAAQTNGTTNHATHNTEPLLAAAILAHKRGVHASSEDPHAQAVSWYNLGWAEHQGHALTGQTDPKKKQRFLKAAMRCFKRAIELEAGNSEFWNALGVVTMNLSPKVSQHSFVRSLHLNETSARVWTNLGILYLVYHDHELANEAFTRAQSADPEYAQAWLGQGLLATLFGNNKESRGLFAHAFEIANSSCVPAQKHYAMAGFDHIIKVTTAPDMIDIVQPLFALRQLHAQSPSDTTSSHLSALLAERAGDHEEAMNTLERVCTTLEEGYEQTESQELFARFAQAKADLARAQLAKGDLTEAVENAQTAMALSSEDDLGPAYASRRRKYRLSAHLTAGLAYHQLGSQDSIGMLQAAYEESCFDPDVCCMLTQVLWSRKDRAAARELLLSCIESHPDHVGAATLLATTALIEGDSEIVEEAEKDLQATRMSDKLDVHDKMKVEKVLAAIAAERNSNRSADHENDRALADATRGVMLAPAQPEGWLGLAEATDNPFPAEMALQIATKQVPPTGTLTAEDLSKAFAQTGKRSDALEAIVVAPWQEQGYKSLADSLKDHVAKPGDDDAT